MKRLCVAALALCLVCCGEESEPTRIPIPQDAPRCLSCGYVPEADNYVPTPAAPRMDLSPSELAFYFMLDYGAEYPPSYAFVTNLTGGEASVTNIRVSDDPTYVIDGDNGAEVFSFTPIELPVVLQDGERLPIEVWFSFTMETHVALLTVETSFNDDVLATELYGKVFDME